MLVIRVKQGLSYLAFCYEIKEGKLKAQINVEWDIWVYIPFDEISAVICNRQIYKIDEFLLVEGCNKNESKR